MRLASSFLVHLSVGDGDARLWHQLFQVGQHRADRLDPVMHEEDLPAAFHLAQDRLLHQAWRIRADMRDDRQALFWRCVDGRDVAHPAQRHVQRARDRRGGQGQHIHLGAQSS